MNAGIDSNGPRHVLDQCAARSRCWAERLGCFFSVAKQHDRGGCRHGRHTQADRRIHRLTVFGTYTTGALPRWPYIGVLRRRGVPRPVRLSYHVDDMCHVPGRALFVRVANKAQHGKVCSYHRLATRQTEASFDVHDMLCRQRPVRPLDVVCDLSVSGAPVDLVP